MPNQELMPGRDITTHRSLEQAFSIRTAHGRHRDRLLGSTLRIGRKLHRWIAIISGARLEVFAWIISLENKTVRGASSNAWLSLNANFENEGGRQIARWLESQDAFLNSADTDRLQS